MISIFSSDYHSCQRIYFQYPQCESLAVGTTPTDQKSNCKKKKKCCGNNNTSKLIRSQSIHKHALSSAIQKRYSTRTYTSGYIEIFTIDKILACLIQKYAYTYYTHTRDYNSIVVCIQTNACYTLYIIYNTKFTDAS